MITNEDNPMFNSGNKRSDPVEKFENKIPKKELDKLDKLVIKKKD